MSIVAFDTMLLFNLNKIKVDTIPRLLTAQALLISFCRKKGKQNKWK